MLRENVQSQINGGYTCTVFLSDATEQVWNKSMLTYNQRGKWDTFENCTCTSTSINSVMQRNH